MLKVLWTSWCCLTALGAGYLCLALPGDGAASPMSTAFLPGETTHGHHQIEMNCNICHLPDGGVKDKSCIDCHSEDLKQSRDTHPARKFVDPTKAVLLQKLDAQNCLSCHVEHQEERTHAMGVTVPVDYCWHCHENVADDRPSHRGMAFSSCSNAGCHNYHDNTALYENFLSRHTGEPAILAEPQNPIRKFQQWLADSNGQSDKQLFEKDADAPLEWKNPDISEAWADSPHAVKGVNCSGCHTDSAAVDAYATGWTQTPNHESCVACHESEVGGFLEGKHGMRPAAGLSKMTPELARLPMHAAAAHKSLDCSACHDPHKPDLQFAAFEACRSCHDDQHSRSYEQSSHFQLWKQELAGETTAGSGVSCATCHMSRDSDGIVNHNQNANLRPNEKMARTVCMNCHGLQFTLDALADADLKNNCYSTAPTASVKSLQMVKDWFDSKKKK